MSLVSNNLTTNHACINDAYKHTCIHFPCWYSANLNLQVHIDAIAISSLFLLPISSKKCFFKICPFIVKLTYLPNLWEDTHDFEG